MPKYSNRFLDYLVDNKVRIKVPNDHDAMSIGYMFESPSRAMEDLIKVRRSSSRQILGDEKMKEIKLNLKSAYGSYKEGRDVPWPSGMSYQADSYIPYPNYGKYSASAGNNRAGNAIPCKESSDWLYNRRMSPNFPIRRPSQNRYGQRVPQRPIRLLNGISQDYYDHRGRTGFANLPSSIYKPDGGNVFYYNYSPYDARTPDLGRSGILPRPFGPRDTAMIKGYPSSPRSPPRGGGNRYGKAGCTPRPGVILPCIEAFRNEYGYRNFSVDDLQDSEEDFQHDFGYETSPSMMGPNLVGYENPYLMYPGAGANTVNFLTGSNYYSPCHSTPHPLKVRPNNNPTGFLSGSDVVPVSGLPGYRSRYGSARSSSKSSGSNKANFSAPNKPWVARGTELGRPYTTQLMGVGDNSPGTGYSRIGQPLDLYTYQNTDYGNKKYPQFLGPRAWYGGFGNGTNSNSSSSRHKEYKSPPKLRLNDIREGDVIHMNKSGRLAVSTNDNNAKPLVRRQRIRKYYY